MTTPTSHPTRSRVRKGTAAIAVALVAPALAMVAAAPASAQEIPTPTDGHNIKVSSFTKVEDLQRTYEVTMTDPAINSVYSVYGAKLRVRITLPEGYADSGRSYPSLYLLHGHPGHVEQWTDTKAYGGQAEQITAGKDVIVVTPEGGKAGWYTNWTNSRFPQNWEKFHINDLIPWVDQNFRTEASKQHRAIGGLSMGGYGAVHYAFKHPDLFNHVSSYSGGLDMEDQAVRVAVIGSVNYQGMGPFDSPFGSPIFPFDGAWKNENPVRHADQLRGVGISLYAGDGPNIIEQGAKNSTNTLANALTAQGIPHVWGMYGHDVDYGGFHCDGNHNQSCFNMALAKDMPRILADIG
ncbi:alpha/beta hydrolase [Flexivirga sp. B27]